MLTDFVNLHDMRMLQSCGRLGFCQKAADMVCCCPIVITQHLERDRAVQFLVASLKHDRHSALTDPVQNLITFDFRQMRSVAVRRPTRWQNFVVLIHRAE